MTHTDLEENDQNSSSASDGRWDLVITFSSFMLCFLVSGVCLSFGVLFPEFIRQFGDNQAKTQSVGSAMVGTYKLVGPLAACLFNRIGTRITATIGAVIACVGIFASTFSPNLDIMILLYGVVAGSGFGLMYLPAVVIIGQYFSKRRALATGIVVSGSGVGSFAFAPFVVYLLETYRWQGALWIVAGVVLNGTVFASFYLQPHTNIKSNENVSDEEHKLCFRLKHIFDFSLFTSPTYILYVLMSSLCSLGYYIPPNFLPALVINLNFSISDGANLLLVMGISNTAFRVLVGYISDKPWADTIIIHSFTLIIGGISTFFVSFYRGYPVFLTYSAVFGMVLAVIVSLRSIILAELMGVERLANSFGVSILFQGISVFIGAPIGGVLADMTGDYTATFRAAGLIFCLAGLICLPLRKVSQWENKKGGNFNLTDVYVNDQSPVFCTRYTRYTEN